MNTVMTIAIVESHNGNGWSYCPESAFPVLQRLLEYTDERGFDTSDAAISQASRDPSIGPSATFQLHSAPSKPHIIIQTEGGLVTTVSCNERLEVRVSICDLDPGDEDEEKESLALSEEAQSHECTLY